MDVSQLAEPPPICAVAVGAPICEVAVGAATPTKGFCGEERGWHASWRTVRARKETRLELFHLRKLWGASTIFEFVNFVAATKARGASKRPCEAEYAPEAYAGLTARASCALKFSA